jgi:hypothetical protein
MAEPDPEHRVERKVVYENVTSTSAGNHIAAWVIIGVAAIALIVYIIVHIR